MTNLDETFRLKSDSITIKFELKAQVHLIAIDICGTKSVLISIDQKLKIVKVGIT